MRPERIEKMESLHAKKKGSTEHLRLTKAARCVLTPLTKLTDV